MADRRGRVQPRCTIERASTQGSRGSRRAGQQRVGEARPVPEALSESPGGRASRQARPFGNGKTDGDAPAREGHWHPGREVRVTRRAGRARLGSAAGAGAARPSASSRLADRQLRRGDRQRITSRLLGEGRRGGEASLPAPACRWRLRTCAPSAGTLDSMTMFSSLPNVRAVLPFVGGLA